MAVEVAVEIAVEIAVEVDLAFDLEIPLLALPFVHGKNGSWRSKKRE